MLAQLRTRPLPTDTEYPTLLDELQAMAAAGLVSLQIDSEGEMRVGDASRATQGPSLLERMQELHAAGAEELYA
jgi:hypothetical protein